jgi:hypothetical protein
MRIHVPFLWCYFVFANVPMVIGASKLSENQGNRSMPFE